MKKYYRNRYTSFL